MPKKSIQLLFREDTLKEIQDRYHQECPKGEKSFSMFIEGVVRYYLTEVEAQ